VSRIDVQMSAARLFKGIAVNGDSRHVSAL